MDKYKTVPFNVTIPTDCLCWGHLGIKVIRCKYFDIMEVLAGDSRVKCWLGFKIKNESSQGFYRPEACVVLTQKEEVKMPEYKEKLKLKNRPPPLLDGKYMIEGFCLACDKETYYSMEGLIELVADGHQNQSILEALNHLVQEMERDLRILKTTIIREWSCAEKKRIEQNLKPTL